jgi:hypothetical protein
MSATVHTLSARPLPTQQEVREPPAAAADARAHYLDAVTCMHDRAIERHELEACVDALTYALAWVAFSQQRLDVTGDILAKFGRHLEALDAEHRTGA